MNEGLIISGSARGIGPGSLNSSSRGAICRVGTFQNVRHLAIIHSPAHRLGMRMEYSWQIFGPSASAERFAFTQADGRDGKGRPAGYLQESGFDLTKHGTRHHSITSSIVTAKSASMSALTKPEREETMNHYLDRNFRLLHGSRVAT